MKLLYMLVLLPLTVVGQFVKNPSFEGPLGIPAPIGWVVCSGSPDILTEGECGFPKTPKAMDSTNYVNIFSVGSSGFFEAVGQQLLDTLYPSKEYVFTIYCYAWYSSSCGVNRSRNNTYQFWIGESSCPSDQLVFTSDTIPVNSGFWRKDSIVFRPNQKSNFIRLINNTNLFNLASYIFIDDVHLYEKGKPNGLGNLLYEDRRRRVDVRPY